MTECTTDVVEFQRLGSRHVVGRFDGGRLTADAGALLLRKVDRQIGLIDAMTECIPDPRDPQMVKNRSETGPSGASGVCIGTGIATIWYAAVRATS